MITVRFEGGAELATRLEALGDEAKKKAVQMSALKKAAEPMRDAMEANAPVRSGRLAENVLIRAVSERESDDDEVSVAVGPGKKTFWGLFQEFGYGPGNPQPFARPAFDSTKGTALNVMGQELWRALRRVLPSNPGAVGGRFA